MHEPWQRDVALFIEQVEGELGSRPEGKSLDRKDNDGNYEPGNLRWATHREQAVNQRKVPELTARIAELEAEVARLRLLLAESIGGGEA
jgi:hypothetical protein